MECITLVHITVIGGGIKAQALAGSHLHHIVYGFGGIINPGYSYAHIAAVATIVAIFHGVTEGFCFCLPSR